MATFTARNRALPTFLGQSLKIVPVLERCTDVFAQKKWVSARFYFKSGQPETVGAQGFAGFLPTFPLFSLISVRKKSNKLYIIGEKSGHLAREQFLRISYMVYCGIPDFERRIIMGINKRLVKMWETNRTDVLTTFKVLAQLDILKEDDITFITESLDRMATARSTKVDSD